jgi:hypothetical protein
MEPRSGTAAARRGLGPFTGGQLTVIIVVAIVALAAPVGAYAAVSGSNAFVTDHSSGVHASASATAGLATSDSPALGGMELTISGTPPDTSCAFTPPGGKAFVITDVTMDPQGASVGHDTGMFVQVSSNSNCTDITHTLAGGYYSADGSYPQSFSPGIGLKNGHSLRVTVSGANDDFLICIYGYLVPASACTGGSCT